MQVSNSNRYEFEVGRLFYRKFWPKVEPEKFNCQSPIESLGGAGNGQSSAKQMDGQRFCIGRLRASDLANESVSCPMKLDRR